MTKKHTFFLFFLSFVILSCLEREMPETPKDFIRYVDPFIGTGGHGHTYPGATTPFGMVQPSPDNGTPGWDWTSGYHYSDSIISGFGQLHLSGTGIGDFADIVLMPVNQEVDLLLFGKPKDSLPYASKFLHEKEVASPGYYKVFLEDANIQVELTASDYVGYHRYTFENTEIPSFILDLGYAVNWDAPVKSHIKFNGDNRITGYRYSTGWAKNQKVFFVIETSQPIVRHALMADEDLIASREVVGKKTGGQFFFESTENPVEVHIAISSVSIENAIENLESTTGAKEFDGVKKETEEVWNNMLSKIQVETPIDSLKTIYYTALYHAQVAPVLFSDVNGEFRLQNDSIFKSDQWNAYSSLSLWDTFRAQTPLLNILHEEKVNHIIRSMLAYYEEKGSLPVWTLYGNETNTMTGYHSVSVIAEAYLKGIQNYDVDQAYKAVYTTMMGNERGLKSYKEYGYIPFTELDESVTISLEFAYNDWCVAQMANALGKTKDYHYFKERSMAYVALFDNNTGFMRGKSDDGKSWHEPFDPKHSNHREHTDYTEGNAWQHSWFVLHDVEGLVELHGGSVPFSEKVEQLFTESSEITGNNTSADISGLIGQYAHGNEPSHHIAYMFNKAGTPWKTQYWVRKILETQYTTQNDGLSGNEDCGQMSAWYVFSALGIYPMNPVSGQYEIGSPLFEKATIKVSDITSFVISAANTSSINKYIQSVTLNGKPLQRTYVLHEEIMAGGELKFEMGSTPNKNWGI